MTRKKTVTLEKLGNGRRLSIDMVHVGFRIRPVRSVNRVTHIRTQRDKEGGKTNTQTAASNGKRGAGVTWHRRRREEKKEKNRGYPYEKIRTTHQTIERNDATVVLLPSPTPRVSSPIVDVDLSVWPINLHGKLTEPHHQHRQHSGSFILMVAWTPPVVHPKKNERIWKPPSHWPLVQRAPTSDYPRDVRRRTFCLDVAPAFGA